MVSDNWLDVLDYFKSDDYVAIVKKIAARRAKGIIVLPEKQNIFRALQLTLFDEVKVVILGQDPYPTPSHAIGLAFSVPSHTYPTPKSLQNIFTELETDLGIVRTNCDLTDWAKQGVLLLNTTLTVEQGNPGSHKAYGWTTLTNEIITKLSEYHDNLVFILWGSHAQEKISLIDSEKHLIIKSSHPSPLGAYRGFFGSKPFSQTNQYLTSKNLPIINW